jgi:hypothetical protein
MHKSLFKVLGLILICTIANSTSTNTPYQSLTIEVASTLSEKLGDDASDKAAKL